MKKIVSCLASLNLTLLLACGSDTMRRTQQLCPGECDAAAIADAASSNSTAESGAEALEAGTAGAGSVPRDAARDPDPDAKPGLVIDAAVSDAEPVTGPDAAFPNPGADAALPDAALLDAATVDAATVDAAIECENPADCVGGDLCVIGNCVRGRCLPSLPRPDIDDFIGCTVDSCDSKSGIVTHSADHGQCSQLDALADCDASGQIVELRGECNVELGCVARVDVFDDCNAGSEVSCTADVVTSTLRACVARTRDVEAHCSTASTELDRCAVDARCTQEGGLVHIAAEYCAADPARCAGGEREACTAPAASCEGANILATHRATCSAAGGCGVATSRSDCRDGEGTTCVQGNYLVTDCGCSGASCACSTSEVICDALPESCVDGEQTESSAGCDEQAGCFVDTKTSLCPVAPDACVTRDGPTHVTYSPTCADEIQCDGTGEPNYETCGADAPRCDEDDYVVYRADCDPSLGCTSVEAERRSCRDSESQSCLDGRMLREVSCSCDLDARSGCSCATTDVLCLDRAPDNVCIGDVLRVYSAGCDAKTNQCEFAFVDQACRLGCVEDVGGDDYCRTLIQLPPLELDLELGVRQ